MVRQNYIFYTWNLLLEAGVINTTNATNATISVTQRRTGESAEDSVNKKKIIMQAMDQFVISQHRSMKLLHGDSIISFMETSLFLPTSPSSSPPPNARTDDDTVETRNLTSYSLSPPPNARTDDDTVETQSPTLNQSNTLSIRRRRLLQSPSTSDIKDRLDKSVRVYSSILTATKGFSKVYIGKNELTDSWLQGPLRWPPR